MRKSPARVLQRSKHASKLTSLVACVLLLAGRLRGARGGTCRGVSPSAHRWIYVQPQHTEAASVEEYLSKELGQGVSWGYTRSVTCEPGHEMTPTNGSGPAATFAFGFVANPYLRVLSHAASEGIINGPRHSNHTRAQDVQAFRQYVKSNVDSHGNPLAALSARIWSQTAMFANFPMRFVGCAAMLASHLQTVLAKLGYGNRAFYSIHSQHLVHVARVGDWYDAEAERRVRIWFRDDLCNFGFNMSSAAMFDASGCEAWAAEPKAKSGLVRPEWQRQAFESCIASIQNSDPTISYVSRLCEQLTCSVAIRTASAQFGS